MAGLIAHAREWITTGCRASLLMPQIRAMCGGRSPKWPALRRKILLRHPTCEACGGIRDLEVHHICPVHIDRSRELDPRNCIVLCMESLQEDHWFVGHRGHSWSDWNPTVRADAAKCLLRREFLEDSD